MTFTDVFNAVVGYYLIVLAVSAAAGVRETLRDPAAASAALASSSTAPAGGATPASPSARSRFGALVHGRSLHAATRFGWATGVGAAMGWATGAELYRAGRRATIAGASRARDWREKRRHAPLDAGIDPAEADADEMPRNTAPPAGAQPAATPPNPPQQGTAPPPPPGRGIGDEPDDDLLPPQWLTGGTGTGKSRYAELIEAARRARLGEDTPELAALTARPGRPPLYLVPPPQEYPKIMPAAEIYDLESLINFTGQTAQVAGMESEDAAAASASMVAGAEFAGETATRVADESAALESALAAMAALRVDAASTSAMAALHEAGQVYRDTTATFSAQCHDAAATAGQMAAAAAHYNESAAAALDVLNRHQMPHAEAANATGHSGAHGAFYGVTDTGSQDALASSGAPQLPAS